MKEESVLPGLIVSLGQKRCRETEFAVHLFEIQPPLPSRVRFAVPHEVVSPDPQAPGDRHVPHGPVHRPVEEGGGLAPGTDLDAGAAARAVVVPDPHGRALLHVVRPLLVAVVHHLVPVADGAGRALAGALPALGAEVLQPEIDRFVRSSMGRSVVTTAALKRGPRKGFSTMSPIRHISPSPAHSRMGGSTTW